MDIYAFITVINIWVQYEISLLFAKNKIIMLITIILTDWKNVTNIFSASRPKLALELARSGNQTSRGTIPQHALLYH